MDDDMDIEAMLDAPLEKKKLEDSVSKKREVDQCHQCKVVARAKNRLRSVLRIYC